MESAVEHGLLGVGGEVAVGIQSEGVGDGLTLDGELAGIKDLQSAVLQSLLHLAGLLVLLARAYIGTVAAAKTVEYRSLDAEVHTLESCRSLDFLCLKTFDACKLAEAAGATYVARSTAFHVQHMTNMIADGLDNKGFSFIEAMVQCPTAFGRKNRMGSPADMLKWMRDHAVMKAAWDKLPEEKREDKFPIGCLYSSQAIDYDAAYDQVIERAGGADK